MTLLNIVFVVLSLISAACAVRNGIDKRRNIGFIAVSVMIAISDIMYIVLLGVRDAKAAARVLLPYYILHAWFLLAFLLMILLIDRFRRFAVLLVVPAGVCIYQTYLCVSQFLGARVFSFQKRIYFRRAFWVAIDTKNTGILFSYRSYQITLCISLIFIMLALVWGIVLSQKIFRTRYYALIGITVAYGVSTWLMIHFSLPVWIPGVVYNVISVLCLYFTGFFARNRLRAWSLDSFANDMSDGLVLYDKYDDLIHINDMVKETLDEGLVKGFKDKSMLEKWIADSADGENKAIITYTGANERKYYFKVSARCLGEKQTQIGTLYILHDTTDSIRRIKAMEKANEELERASRMKSDFLANMSHEIRTPMNAVIGMTELAMRETDSPQITDYLLQIQNSGRNLLNIINDILDYSKIESGKMEIIEDEYEPFTELSDIANVLVTRIGEKPLELFVVVDSDLPHKLCGDAMRIRQVLINLANNAIKFTPVGIVKIHVKCEMKADGMAQMMYHVIDTGIGIKEEEISKLFVRFQQLDSKRNRSVEGTGLGLAISQRLVGAMAGEIGVESEYGKGSDFWFTIPQKVVDATNDIAVENASEKHAFVLDENNGLSALFVEEVKRLGVDGSVITSLENYSPTGKREYLFFKEERYDDQIRGFLETHKNVEGISLAAVTSEFAPDRPNLHVMRRPETTMNMVQTLNNRYSESRIAGEEKAFHADFTAPDAKILVVDDNRINLTIAGGLMAPLKVQVDTAGGGQEAIDKVKANPYDIVFMDHMMPEIDGVDATKTIRAAGEISNQPVIIALSANVMEEAKRLFREAGMDDFVAKPVDVRELTNAIKRWLPADKIREKDSSAVEETHDDEVRVRCEGLEIENAVRALGSAALYDKIAEEYYRTGADKLNSILADFEQQNWADYTIKVHALKSSSRQIGAMELGSMAEALEKAGKAGDIDTIKADTGSALEAFRELLGKLEVFFPETEEDDADKPMIGEERLNGLLDELEAACDDLDLDAMEEVGSKLKQYAFGEDRREDIEALYKAISDIDMDECVEIVHRLR